jgi:hypothetical protein
MSSGLVTVKCSNCHQETEIIPGTIIAECDHCGRLFKPDGEGGAGATPSSFSPGPSSSSDAPPWETGPSTSGPKPSWEPEPTANVPTPSLLRTGTDGQALSARGAQEADAVDAALRDQLEQDRRDRTEARRQASRSGGRPVEERASREAAPGGGEASSSASRSARPSPASPPSATSAAPAVFIFITLLVMAIGAYVMARKEETGKKSEQDSRAQERRPGRTAPATETDQTPPAAPPDTAAPTEPPSKSLTPAQRVGMNHVEQHSVVMSSGQLEIVRKSITHRESHPFHFWGSKTPKLEIVVFAPFTHMGIARLRQMNTEFKKLEPYEDRIAVWFVYHWGSDQGLEAEAASIANAIHWTYKPEGMYHFVNLLQKEATWRVPSLAKLDEYIRTVGLDPVKVRASLETLPIQTLRREVAEVMTALQFPDKDLTFLIGGRGYVDGKTLYHVARIVDYELAAREP